MKIFPGTVDLKRVGALCHGLQMRSSRKEVVEQWYGSCKGSEKRVRHEAEKGTDYSGPLNICFSSEMKGVFSRRILCFKSDLCFKRLSIMQALVKRIDYGGTRIEAERELGSNFNNQIKKLWALV